MLGYDWSYWLKSFEEKIEIPVVIRLDGKDFHNIYNYCKNFDKFLGRIMLKATKELMLKTEFKAQLAYIIFDEVNFLFTRKNPLPYNGKARKILTLLASYLTSIFQKNLEKYCQYSKPLGFEAMIIDGNAPVNYILEYFKWRCFHTLQKAKILKVKSKWRKYGVTLYFERASNLLVKKYIDFTSEEGEVLIKRILSV